jgi:hypothetical protein
MQNEQTPDIDGNEDQEYKRFATKRVAAGILIVALVIWMASVIFGFFESAPNARVEKVAHNGDTHAAQGAAAERTSGHEAVQGQAAHSETPAVGHTQTALPGEDKAVERYKNLFDRHGASQGEQAASEHVAETAAARAQVPGVVSDHGSDEPLPAEPAPEPHPLPAPVPAPHGKETAEKPHAAPSHGDEPVVSAIKARGVVFAEALIAPMDYELNERFWGWRPNDIINVTDNVNNFQLGVLEVTRRTTIVLTERISRIGSAASFDDNMEQAMNWFMIKASAYWLPSPETKYNEGLDNLRQYAHDLETGLSRFYTRTDNLIPLLAVYKDLLGSCDENLVKDREDDGEEVSFFKADDYFYYAQGVASAMMGLLEAVQVDFDAVLETRRARDALHHAVESLHHALDIHPWFILDSDLSSIFANHRANMAASISHARFYLDVAIEALST